MSAADRLRRPGYGYRRLNRHVWHKPRPIAQHDGEDSGEQSKRRAKRRHIAGLLRDGAFDKIAFLKGAGQPSKVAEVWKWEDIDAQIRGNRFDDSGDEYDWHKHVGQFVKKGV